MQGIQGMNQNSLFCKFRSLARRTMDKGGDWLLGIDTISGSGGLPQCRGRFADANRNGPVSYWLLQKYLGHENYRSSDVFYDIGCGYGRVLCFMARYRLKQCVGIEISADFAERAVKNANKMRGRLSPIEVRVSDAAEERYDSGTIYFFGNPFGAGTMQEVLGRIRQTLMHEPRRVRCIFWLPSYFGPEVPELVRSTEWLQFESSTGAAYSPIRVEYWRNFGLTAGAVPASA